MKQYFIHTFGCQMNEYDSVAMEKILQSKGYRSAASAKEADVVIVNSCMVRDKAEQKGLSALGRYLALKRENPERTVGFTGCVASVKGSYVRERFPAVDFVLKAHEVKALADEISPEVAIESPFPTNVPSLMPVTGYLTVQIGCNRYCSYCIIPKTRGIEVSRPVADIVAEARTLVGRGVREITLLGQIIDAYHGVDEEGKDRDLAYLFYRLNEIPELLRIRFTTSHPNYLHPSLIVAFNEVPKLCPHLHLPFQAGSNRILKLMRRQYTREEYLHKIAEVRTIAPQVAIGADCIVGFPGESAEEFEETLDLVRVAELDYIYSFLFSPRPGTRAALFEDPVPVEEKKVWLNRLQSLQAEISLKKNQRLVGSVQKVLVEGASRTNANRLSGRTPTHKVVSIISDSSERTSVKGEEWDVRIRSCTPNALLGERV